MNRLSLANGTGAIVLAAACWGLGTVISKAVLTHVPPLTLLVVQLAVSVCFLWSLIWVARVPLLVQQELIRLGLAGWLNPGLAYTFGLIGLTMTTASMSSLIWAAEPALILALAWLFLRDRPPMPVIVWSGVAMVGAVIVVGTGLSSGSNVAVIGNLLILTAVFCCATYTVLTRRSVDKVNPLLLTAVQQTVSLVWALLIWFIAWQRGMVTTVVMLTPIVWFWAAVSGLIYYALAFWTYIIGLRHMPASLAGQFLNLIPIFGIGSAFLILGERLSIGQWLGAFVILMAVFVISRLYQRLEEDAAILLTPGDGDSWPSASATER